MDEQLIQFQDMLTSLLSPDNDKRKQAEASYEEIPLEQRAALLLRASKCQDISPEVRPMTLVLLRRLLSNNYDDLWKVWGDDVKAEFKQELLTQTTVESDPTLRKRLAEVIAELARNTIDDEGNQGWPEVLTFLFTGAASADPQLRLVSLQIFEGVPGIFGTQQEQRLGEIKGMLTHCLNDQSSMDVRGAAVKATCSFISDNEDDLTLMRTFADILPQLLLICAEYSNAEQGEELYECLMEVASSAPKFLRPRLNDLCTLCLKVVSNQELSDPLRHSALEVLVSFTEALAPAMRKDGQRFIPELVQQCLSLMIELEDDPEWALSDEAEEDDGESSSTVGETSLDRFACALGGKALMPPCIDSIRILLSNTENWKCRYAGLMALSAIGEGCHKLMTQTISGIIDSVLPFLQDPHPRVQFAACNALGQMSTDFAPTLQKNCHSKVISGLLGALESSVPRVKAHAGAALVNFSEDCPKEILTTYLEPIMAKLEWVLQNSFQELGNGKKLVLEQIITTVASVADTAEQNFLPFYDKIMPCLKYLLEHASGEDYKMLRGKTVECISLIGLAVGREKFLPDAGPIMELFVKTQQAIGGDGDQELALDDPQVSYMISAWARMCKVIGKDFAQYLPLVMPSVMKAASLKPEVALLEADDVKDMNDDSEDWEFIKLGDQSFGIRTAGLEDKATACQMLGCYARELKEAFADYVEEVAKIMVPLLKFYFHDGVRVAAAESIPHLLECATFRGPDFLRQLWAYICPELLKAIDTDPESEALSEHMHALSESIQCLGPNCLTEEQMKELVQTLTKHLENHFEKQKERQEKRKGEDYDEEVETELVEEDDEDVYLISKVSDINHALFGVNKEAFLPYFEMLVPQYQKLLEEGMQFADLQWGICLFDDVIEYAGEPMLKALYHEQAAVRQAAAYGFGVMGMNGGNGYAQACAEGLPLLGRMIEAEGSRADEESTLATENAIAAAAKILKYNASMIDTGAVIPHFLKWLPTAQDKEEQEHIYNYFLDLLESNHPSVVGGEQLPAVVAMCGEALHLDAFSECPLVKERMVGLLKQLQGNQEIFQACLTRCTSEQQAALQAVLV